MLERKNHESDGKVLPIEWVTKVEVLMNSVYERQLAEQDKSFSAYGKIFDDELLLIVSLISRDKSEILPVACFLSLDVDKSIAIEKALDNLLDMAGIVFDSVFAKKDWNDYEDMWMDETFNGISFHYKISRENIELTLEADKILSKTDSDN